MMVRSGGVTSELVRVDLPLVAPARYPRRLLSVLRFAIYFAKMRPAEDEV